MDFQYLFSPIKIGATTFRNRVMFAPHGLRMGTEENLPSDKMVHYFAERAKGGVGSIVLGSQWVAFEGMSNMHANLITDERAIPGYRRIADAVHDYDTKLLCQLSHAGRQMGSDYSRQAILAPSPLPCPVKNEIPKEMDHEDIENLVNYYREAVEIVKEAGLDGVELYTAHGYLLNQFLSPHSNHRQDEYGGSEDNRLRLLLQILKEIRMAAGDSFLVGLRMNGDDLTDGGLDPVQYQSTAQKILTAVKVDYLHVTGGTYNARAMQIADMSYPPGLFVPLAAAVKSVVDVPVAAVNRIKDPVEAERILAEGKADLIAMARALIADPEWVNKAREGRMEEIRYCLSCNECHRRINTGYALSCTQNPAVCLEKDFGIGKLPQIRRSKHVVVVGGGPAGLEAAVIAGTRGHKVTLFEKENILGGQVNLACKVAPRSELDEVIRYRAHKLANLKISLRSSVEADEELILAEEPDAVIVATGSEPLRTGYTSARPESLSLPGVEQDNVITFWEALVSESKIGPNVVLLDEDFDFLTTSTAEHLAALGHQVTIISRSLYIGTKLYIGTLGPQYSRLAARNVKLRPQLLVKEISGSKVVCTSTYNRAEEIFDGVDTVVLAMGRKAKNSLYYSLKGKVPDVYCIGDALAPRRIIDAVYDGYLAGRSV